MAITSLKSLKVLLKSDWPIGYQKMFLPFTAFSVFIWRLGQFTFQSMCFFVSVNVGVKKKIEKMKSSLSLVFCIVLIYGKICSCKVNTNYEESVSSASACALRSLKTRQRNARQIGVCNDWTYNARKNTVTNVSNSYNRHFKRASWKWKAYTSRQSSKWSQSGFERNRC